MGERGAERSAALGREDDEVSSPTSAARGAGAARCKKGCLVAPPAMVRERPSVPYSLLDLGLLLSTLVRGVAVDAKRSELDRAGAAEDERGVNTGLCIANKLY
jgi:hypothetical protein